jgi:hypothetical protein
LAHSREGSVEKEEVKAYYPFSDGFFTINHIPFLIYEVSDQPSRMLFQAHTLARRLFAAKVAAKDAPRLGIVVAIYFDEFLEASRYLLYSPDGKKVNFTLAR